MPTVAELTRKHEEKVEKLKEADLNRIKKLLEKTTYYDHEFTNKQWLAAIQSLIASLPTLEQRVR